jgi:hypothetical protein
VIISTTFCGSRQCNVGGNDENERWIEKDFEGSAHSLIEVASQCFPAGSEDNHCRALNTVRSYYRPRSVSVFQLARYESKLTYNRSHVHSNRVILILLAVWRETYGLAEQLLASSRNASCCVILYIIIVFPLNTIIKISFTFTLYNKYIDLNGMAVCYMLSL